MRDIEQANREAFHESAWLQRSCQGCDSFGPFESHHVTEKRKLKQVGRLDLLWDTRNAMRLCPDCHNRHTNRAAPIPLSKLTDEHFEFAFYALGAAAHTYLGQSYSGNDDRLELYLAEWEEEHGQRASESAV